MALGLHSAIRELHPTPHPQGGFAMNPRYVSIAATALAALVVGISPAAAQTTPNTGMNFRTDHTANTNADDEGAVDNGAVDTPSASPRGDDDATSNGGRPDDQDMKNQQRQMEQIDRNSDRDLASNSKK